QGSLQVPTRPLCPRRGGGAPGPAGSASQPSGNEDWADVLSGVFANAVDRAGTGPEHRPPQVAWVPLDLGVEEVDGGARGPQELVGVVEVLPGLRDRPVGVVVEVLVLVTRDDMPGFERRDLVDRRPPWPEAIHEHTLPEPHVNAVVDHIPGDNQPEIRNVDDAGVVGVAVADLHKHEVVSFEREAVVRDRHRRDGRWRDPWVHLVPKKRTPGDGGLHLRDRARGGDDAGPESFCQQSGGEPVIAVAVGDEDVGQLPMLAGDPVAERSRLIRRERGVRQHRILAPIDQRARDGRAPLRLAVRKDAVEVGQRVVDEDVVAESHVGAHDAVLLCKVAPVWRAFQMPLHLRCDDGSCGGSTGRLRSRVYGRRGLPTTVAWRIPWRRRCWPMRTEEAWRAALGAWNPVTDARR